MVSILAALWLTSVAYTLPTTPTAYLLTADFDGFIPVLGGTEGKVTVKMGFTVTGLAADADGNAQASSDLTDAELKFNGAPLPFDVDSVRNYFPKNTISFSTAGKITKNDAPDLTLPVRLPGLDVKRFPDITYLPIEFPAAGIEVGTSFEFKKMFGDSEVSYVATPTKLESDTLHVDVKLKQAYDNFEDEAKNVVKEKDAVSKVHTVVNGTGTIDFDLKKGMVTSSKVEADSVSNATDIKTGKVTERKLKTTLKVELKPAK